MSSTWCSTRLSQRAGTGTIGAPSGSYSHAPSRLPNERLAEVLEELREPLKVERPPAAQRDVAVPGVPVVLQVVRRHFQVYRATSHDVC